MPALEIDLNTLPEIGNSYEFSMGADWFESALSEVESAIPSAKDAGQVTVMVQRTGRDVLVHGSVAAEIQLRCVRSLEDFMFPVSSDLSALFSPASGDPRDAAKSEDEDAVDRDVFSGSRLVLDGFVREHIILEIPMNPTCVGPDASLQIPDHVGAEAFEAAVAIDQGNKESTEEGSVDPRLAPLRELARKMSGKKE